MWDGIRHGAFLMAHGFHWPTCNRNYHIFFQLIEARQSNELKGTGDPEEFETLNSDREAAGGCGRLVAISTLLGHRVSQWMIMSGTQTTEDVTL